MGATADKVKGATNEAIGKAKQGVGEAVGSDKMQGEGAIQEAKGHAQKAVGDAKQAAKDAVNKAAAAANKISDRPVVDWMKDRSIGPVFFLSAVAGQECSDRKPAAGAYSALSASRSCRDSRR